MVRFVCGEVGLRYAKRDNAHNTQRYSIKGSHSRWSWCL